MAGKTFILQDLSGTTRLDRALRTCFPTAGRKAINRLIQERQVQVNGRIVWLNSWKVQNGDRLTVASIPQALPKTAAIFDEAWLIAEDEDVIAINKPSGLLSQATAYGEQANLFAMVTARFGHVTLFHRLDRDTSGVILFTRGGAINRYLDMAFKSGRIGKHYQAWVAYPNSLLTEGTIHTYLAPHPKYKDRMQVVERGGKIAVTDYHTDPVHSQTARYQRVYLTPRTGRTHQLRLHCAHLGAPILGDRLYSSNFDQYQRLYLHAHHMHLPQDGHYSERQYTAPLPAAFTQLAQP